MIKRKEIEKMPARSINCEQCFITDLERTYKLSYSKDILIGRKSTGFCTTSFYNFCLDYVGVDKIKIESFINSTFISTRHSYSFPCLKMEKIKNFILENINEFMEIE